MFLPSHNAAQILLPQIPTSLEHPKLSSVGKVLTAMTRLLQKWLRVQHSNWYKKGTQAIGSRWHKAVEVDGDI